MYSRWYLISDGIQLWKILRRADERKDVGYRSQMSEQFSHDSESHAFNGQSQRRLSSCKSFFPTEIVKTSSILFVYRK